MSYTGKQLNFGDRAGEQSPKSITLPPPSALDVQVRGIFGATTTPLRKEARKRGNFGRRPIPISKYDPFQASSLNERKNVRASLLVGLMVKP